MQPPSHVQWFRRRSGGRTERGMSLIDAVVGVSLMTLVFLGFFGVFRLSLSLVISGKAKTGAAALASDEMEYIRSLPYDSVGTVGGIPAGVVSQTETISLNNIDYTRRVLVVYVDDAHDGSGGSDENSLTTDYKRVKVIVSWNVKGVSHSISLLSNIVPKGIESTAGGGTLEVQVLSAVGEPISGASVRITNDTLSPAIDLTTYTNTSGIVFLPGAPAGSQYNVVVTKTGYSSTQTYEATAENPNPNPITLSVVEDELTTTTFQIDRLGSIEIATKLLEPEITWTDSFNDGARLEETSSATTSAGALALVWDGTGYTPSGSAYSTAVSDFDLQSWDSLHLDAQTASGTSVTVHLYYEDAGVRTLVPESDLAGNTAGFTSSIIDISSLSTTTYPALIIGAELGTTDPLQTPSIDEWSITYEGTSAPLPDIALDLRGNKTIGADADALPIYKYSESLSTDGEGTLSLPSMEWDTYSLSVDSEDYSVARWCAPPPILLDPADSVSATLYFRPKSANSLHLTVLTPLGTPAASAHVHLTGPGTDEEVDTDACGQIFVGSLSAGSYNIEITDPLYQTLTVSGVSVSGATEASETLSSL